MGGGVFRKKNDMVKQLVEEFGIDLSVTLVPTSHNRADRLTPVPAGWVRVDTGTREPAVAAAVVGSVTDGRDEGHGDDAGGVVDDAVVTNDLSTSTRSMSELDTPVFDELSTLPVVTYRRISRGTRCVVWCQTVTCVAQWTGTHSSGVAENWE